MHEGTSIFLHTHKFKLHLNRICQKIKLPILYYIKPYLSISLHFFFFSLHCSPLCCPLVFFNSWLWEPTRNCICCFLFVIGIVVPMFSKSKNTFWNTQSKMYNLFKNKVLIVLWDFIVGRNMARNKGGSLQAKVKHRPTMSIYRRDREQLVTTINSCIATNCYRTQWTSRTCWGTCLHWPRCRLWKGEDQEKLKLVSLGCKLSKFETLIWGCSA